MMSTTGVAILICGPIAVDLDLPMRYNCRRGAPDGEGQGDGEVIGEHQAAINLATRAAAIFQSSSFQEVRPAAFIDLLAASCPAAIAIL